ncbi:MAG: 5-formyltetrahydrofolate cyclo-ligase [Myxococcaceae bacterium]|nr:5-formyltetrahydrofolate cyclo-ligase [Myxococcaceae bacterium]
MSEGMTEVQDTAAQKASLREILSARRKALTPQMLDSRGLKVQARFLATPYYERARTIALYAPIRGEVPTRDILVAALADGKTVVYPLSHVHGRILSFRAITSESELEPGRLGVREPQSSSELVPMEKIDLFVVPGLGFTRDGKRLGRGGGYYDATLKAAAERSRRVGLAFSEQVVDVIPVNGEDVPMDLVVTENETHRGLFRGWDFNDT